MRIVLRHDRHNGHTGLDGEMESTFLERKEHRIVGITPGALGENEDTLAMDAHLIHGSVESLHGRLTVSAVDKDSSRKRHKPAQEGHIPQRLLRRHTAVGRENRAQHEHIQFGLVVANEDGRAGGEELFALDNVEGDAGGEAHHPFEAASGGPLGDTAVAGEPEDDGGNYAVGSAQEKRAISGQTAGEKCCARHFLADGEERQGHYHEGADARQDIGTDRHGGIGRLLRSVGSAVNGTPNSRGAKTGNLPDVPQGGRPQPTGRQEGEYGLKEQNA